MTRYLFSLLPCVTLVSGCISTVDIDAEDETRFSTLAASLPLDGGDNTWLRFRATQVDGSFDQSLDFDESIRFEDTTIDGPDLVDGDLDLAYYSITLGSGSGTSGGVAGQFRSETHIGIAQTRFDLDMESSNRQLEISDDTVEFYVQWAVIAPINDTVDFGFGWALSLGEEFSGISEIDLQLSFDVAKHLTITGGYRWFDYEYDADDGDGDSNLEVDFRGPFLGARVSF